LDLEIAKRCGANRGSVGLAAQELQAGEGRSGECGTKFHLELELTKSKKGCRLT
jgi:hypothetical protein